MDWLIDWIIEKYLQKNNRWPQSEENNNKKQMQESMSNKNKSF